MKTNFNNEEIFKNIKAFNDTDAKQRKTLDSAIKQYPNYLASEGRTKSTIQAYMQDLSLFLNYFKKRYPNLAYTDQLTKPKILDYFMALEQLNGKQYKRTTLDRKKDAVFAFSHYLYQNEYTSTDIMIGYKFDRLKKRYSPDNDEIFNPYILTDTEISTILKSILMSSDDNKYRDYTIFLMLAEFGCRRSSVLSLQWEDINLITHEIMLRHPKDKKCTYVPMSQNFEMALQRCIFITKKKTGAVFLSQKTLPLSDTAFNQVMHKRIKQAGLDDTKITSHSFRHTFITKCINKNINPYKIIRYTGTELESLEPYYNYKTSDLIDITEFIQVKNLDAI